MRLAKWLGRVFVFIPFLLLCLAFCSFSVKEQAFGGGIDIRPDTTYTMTDGTISGDTNTGLNVGGSLSMSGGTVTKNSTATDGGGVWVSGGATGTFNMSGGYITYNTAGNSGGGVYTLKNFTMSGGEISNNTATESNGGGVYISGANFTFSKGTITSNTAGYGGGGVYLNTGSTMEMTGGSIYDNEAKWGSEIFCYGATLNVRGGTIGSASPKKGDNIIYLVDETNFNYYGGTIYSTVEISTGAQAHFYAEPTTNITIKRSSNMAVTGDYMVIATIGEDVDASKVWSKLSVTNVPSGYGATLEGRNIVLRRIVTVSFDVNNTALGSVSPASYPTYVGAQIRVSGNMLVLTEPDGNEMPVAATPKDNHEFASWSRTSGTITEAITITANFNEMYLVSFRVNTSSYGIVDPGSVVVPRGTTISVSGVRLILTKPNNLGSVTVSPVKKIENCVFQKWSKTSGTITSNTEIEAVFLAKLTISFRVNESAWGSVEPTSCVVADGAVLKANGAVITITQPSGVTELSNVTITATAVTNKGTFSRWVMDNGADLDGEKTLTDSTRFIAWFEEKLFNIAIKSSSSTYGSVSPTSVDVPYGTTYSASGKKLTFTKPNSAGTVVVTATEKSGGYFKSWSKSSGTVTADMDITADFVAVYTLTIKANNSSYGQVRLNSGTSSTTVTVSVPSGTTISYSGTTLTINKLGSYDYVYALETSSGFFERWSYSSSTITSSSTINANFVKGCNVSFTANGMGQVTPSKVKVPTGTSFYTSGSTFFLEPPFGSITNVTAKGTRDEEYMEEGVYSSCSPSSISNITSDTTITVYFNTSPILTTLFFNIESGVTNARVYSSTNGTFQSGGSTHTSVSISIYATFYLDTDISRYNYSSCTIMIDDASGYTGYIIYQFDNSTWCPDHLGPMQTSSTKWMSTSSDVLYASTIKSWYDANPENWCITLYCRKKSSFLPEFKYSGDDVFNTSVSSSSKEMFRAGMSQITMGEDRESPSSNILSYLFDRRKFTLFKNKWFR